MLATKKTLEQLFISKVRIKALRYFLMHPDKRIHLRGAVREFREEINAVRRELERLEEINFLDTERQGNRKYFSVNKDHPYFNEFLPIIHKAFGLGGDILRHQAKLGNIQFALLTNAYTKNVRQGMYVVDLLVVGDVDMEEVAELVDKSERKLQREIHYTVLKPNEFVLRKKRRDAFVMEILLQPKVMLIGRAEDLVANAG